MTIAKKIAYSIPTVSTGATAIDALELTVVDPDVVPDVSGDKFAYAVLCSNSNFSDTTADYETIKVTDDDAGTLTIERAVEGAAKEWPDGSAIRFSGTYSGYQDLVTDISGKAELVAFDDVIETGDWAGSAPAVATVAVAGMLATDNPVIDIDLSGAADYAAEIAIVEAWGYVYLITTADDEITAYATDTPAVDIPVQIKVVR
jgi:hypothetical protein